VAGAATVPAALVVAAAVLLPAPQAARSATAATPVAPKNVRANTIRRVYVVAATVQVTRVTGVPLSLFTVAGRQHRLPLDHALRITALA
jgi:hypothetical protein